MKRITQSSLYTPPKLPSILSKKKLISPSTTAPSPNSNESYNEQGQENYSMVKLIGHDKLLSSAFNNSSNNLVSESNTRASEDRFIPSRKLLKNTYSSIEYENTTQSPQNKDPQTISIAQIYYQHILNTKQSLESQYSETQELQQYKNTNLLKYRYIPQKSVQNNCYNEYMQESDPTRSLINIHQKINYNRCRKINKVPCKVLDAPALQDDFYLNLIDWSYDNHLAVGLGNCIYLWNAQTSKVTKLCQLANDHVTSVCWASKGSLVSIGCNKGDVLVWDINYSKQIRKMGGHDSRVGAMTWNSKVLATGSRDKVILQRDVRVPTDYVHRMVDHNQQICGLKWSLDQQYLASGGNDNKVIVWTNSGQIVNKFTDHKAAVKALAWSPHQHGLLATGGGTADRMIKMRNIFTGKIICQKDAGSQVCNIAFSKSLHQIVSTHGYSQNQINIWTYPNMKKTATLIGHSQRVLYLATSPDGSTIVTGAGDETLRFWNVFPSVKDTSGSGKNVSLIENGPNLR